jgi:hypothetical protein
VARQRCGKTGLIGQHNPERRIGGRGRRRFAAHPGEFVQPVGHVGGNALALLLQPVQVGHHLARFIEQGHVDTAVFVRSGGLAGNNRFRRPHKINRCRF